MARRRMEVMRRRASGSEALGVYDLSTWCAGAFTRAELEPNAGQARIGGRAVGWLLTAELAAEGGDQRHHLRHHMWRSQDMK